jgi:NADH-quinone oxidoreductase subunit H
MIVASTRALRNQGYEQLSTGLISVGAVVALILLFVLWRTLQARNIRRIPEQAVDTGVFPVPPLPTKKMASKEKTRA